MEEVINKFDDFFHKECYLKKNIPFPSRNVFGYIFHRHGESSAHYKIITL